LQIWNNVIIIGRMSHNTTAIVITCIDFRFQKYINKWLKYVMKDYIYDRVALAGGIFDLYSILKQVEISNRLHHIKQVILMNHEDCGAYGDAGTYERHKQDLLEAEKIIEKLYPHLNVSCKYIHLDGKIEDMSKTKPEKTLKYPYHKKLDLN
jgi:carbonic anhydrase